MQRQIKFRGKTLEKWVYGATFAPHDYAIIKTSDGKEHTILAETLGQYVNCKDDKGTEIYEGDILRVTRDGEEPYITLVGPYGEIDYDTDYCDSTLLEWVWSDCEKVEVIGNRLDNPELLKGGNNAD